TTMLSNISLHDALPILRRPPLRAPSRHLGGGGLFLARTLAPRRRGGHLPADHRRRQRPSDRRGRGGAGASGRHRGAPAGVAPADTRQRIGLRIRLRPAGLAVVPDPTPSRLADPPVAVTPSLDRRLHETMSAVAAADAAEDRVEAANAASPSAWPNGPSALSGASPTPSTTSWWRESAPGSGPTWRNGSG